MTGATARALARPARVLVVEDEAHLAAGIRENLEAEGYCAEVAGDGEAALTRWRQGGIDLIVLDVMLPHRDGYAVCRAIRAAGDPVPILFLTAKNLGTERVTGLEAGADDYLGKPFALRELLLRVAALWRRAGSRPVSTYRLAGHAVDLRSGEITCPEGETQVLPQRTCALLALLVAHPDEVLRRETIVEALWGDDVWPASRAVDALVADLRARFEPDPASPRLFVTVPGVGYRFVPTGADG